MRKKIIRSGICISLAGMLLLSACQTSGKKADSTQTKMEASKLANSVRMKYEKDEKYNYTEPIQGIKRDERIEVQMGFDIKNAGFERYTELVEIYKDDKLTQPLGTHFEWDEEKQVLAITPPKWSDGGIMTDSAKEANQEAFGDDGGVELYDKGELNDWGNLSQYYLVRYVNTEDGTKLDKPLVSVVTVKRELKETPEVKMQINEAGLPEFSWKKIKGALGYYIMEMNYYEDKGLSGGGYVQGYTEETSWVPKDGGALRTYDVSEAERGEAYNVEKYGEGTGAILKESDYETYYCVIAVSEDGTSALSNSYSESEIARKTPYAEEVAKSLQDGQSNYTKGVLNVPSYKWVTMCDGTLVQKIINYDFDKAKETKETWGEYENEDMSDLQLKEVELITIPYTIDGTGFTGTVKIEAYSKETWKAELKEVKNRQDALRNKGGNKEPEIDMQPSDDESSAEQEVVQTDYKITANSALSEYLAANMLVGTTVIDLSEFPERSDQTLLYDAWMEAVYQNPLILDVERAALSGDGKKLLVTYGIEADEMQKKQKEIVKEVKKVVGEIITDDMTELDKELAINQYLCDTAEYDTKALENAEKNDFATVDPEFSDSFNPYGVMLNKVGVCASYAGAFKLMADEAGLQSIVVTGDLEGNLPHAWNKVLVDQQWEIVDSTNNDNEMISNALLNLSNGAADKVLVEDERYILDEKAAEYIATAEDKEYYRTQGKYFPQDQIATMLTQELNENGTSVLRTDYNLDDEQFAVIAQNVLQQYGSDQLAGYYWMGVIYLTNEVEEE